MMNLQARVVVAALIFALSALAQGPRLESLEPPNGRSGDELVVKGANLGEAYVSKLYLTIGTSDLEVEVREQTADTIRFAIPADAKPGRYNLTVETAGPTPTIMVQPIFCTVEE